MRHRDDLQGLRAVAVLLVVLNHAGVPVLAGGYVGVDVFFVLSGFLITGLLLAQAERRGSVSLGEFYVRRARRILPAAALTLVVTDVAAFYLLNFVRAREAVSDSIWASLFAANTHFAAQQSDYFAQAQPASPVLQFWTLSVEEQFYVVWPSVLSLVMFGALFGRRLRLRRARSAEPGGSPAVGRLVIVVALAGIASLVWSIHSTDTSPTTAYFSTFARAWELALGAGLAVAASSLKRVPGRARFAMGWLGLGAIVCAAVLFSGSTAFPGYAALLPAVGAALVIAAGIGRTQTRMEAGRLLSIGPFRYVGDRSYALYLWHWPFLIIAAQYAGHELSIGAKLVLVACAFLLSIVTYRFFENPIRRLRFRVRFGALLWPASAAAVLVVAFPILGSLGSTAARFDAAAAAVRPAALTDPAVLAAAKTSSTKPLPAVVAAVRAAQRGASLPSPLTPSVSVLKKDVWHFPKGCIPTPESTSSNLCRLGDLNAKRTMVIFGDSHAQMWMPTLLRLAAREGWTIIPIVKASCIPRKWAEPGKCNVWYRWARRHAAALHAQVTLIVASWANAYGPGLAVKPIGVLSRAMKRSSLSVVVVGDAPGQSQDPVDCLLAPDASMKTCTTVAKRSQLRADDAIAYNAKLDGVGFINTRGWFCARGRRTSETLCPLVVNQTITAIDRGHISQTYGLELVPSFRAAFRRALFGYA
jgi:peptidoglycan/LPS O-acetylase OafA/YrhL